MRDKLTSFDYIFELGKGRINILQTLLMFFTFVKVYSLSSEFTYMLVTLLFVGVFLLGWGIDKIHIPERMADQKEQRSPFMKKVISSQTEILKRLDKIEAKNGG